MQKTDVIGVINFKNIKPFPRKLVEHRQILRRDTTAPNKSFINYTKQNYIIS
jgi:hypothetical protein